MSFTRQAAHLCGIFIALSIWGEPNTASPLEAEVLIPSLPPGIYTCLFIVTLVVLRAKRTLKYTHVLGAISTLYLINFVGTGTFSWRQVSYDAVLT